MSESEREKIIAAWNAEPGLPPMKWNGEVAEAYPEDIDAEYSDAFVILSDECLELRVFGKDRLPVLRALARVAAAMGGDAPC